MPKQNQPAGYTVGRWQDYDNYTCDHCPWSTLDLDRMEQHQIDRHIPQPVVRPVEPEMYDRFGNRIAAIVEPPHEEGVN